MKVRISFNLAKRTFTIRDFPETVAKLIEASSVQIEDVFFVYDEEKQNKSMETKKRSLHAFVAGNLKRFDCDLSIAIPEKLWSYHGNVIVPESVEPVFYHLPTSRFFVDEHGKKVIAAKTMTLIREGRPKKQSARMFAEGLERA